MADIVTILIQGAMQSALYALVAVGFTLIFGVGGVLNLAHGASITLGAFAAYFAANVYGFGVPGAVAAAVLVPALFGAVVYFALIRAFQDEPVVVMILTLVVAVGIESVIRVALGTSSFTVPLLVTGTSTLEGVSVQHNMIAIFVLSWAMLLGLFLWVEKTDTGAAILATSMDRKGAFLVGIDTGRINLMMWILASVLAGVAGFFLGSHLTATWNMGRTPLVLSFAIVILGGLGSIRGSIVGAYVIGMLEVATTNVIDPRLQGLMPLVVLLGVLLLRPAGLFGKEVAPA